MTRQRAKKIAEQVGRELETLPAKELQRQEYPQAYKLTVDGEELQVEINLLESTPEYLHLGISADNGGLMMATFPPGTSVIVHKDNS